MKVEVKKIDGTKREINVAVTGDVVKNKFESVFAKIAKEAKAPGFRVGHVPRDILEKNFSDHAHEMVLRELIPDVYNEAIDKEKIDVIGLPDISEVKLDRSNLSFRAVVEVSPEIKLGKYKGLKVSYKRIAATPDEIKRNLDALKESRKLETLDDAFARSMGYPDMAEFEKAIERQILAQKENQQRQKIESELVKGVADSLEFKVPETLIERQLQDLLRQVKMDLALKGVSREKIESEEQELAKKLRPEAEKQVKVYMVLSEIAKKENIASDEHMPHKVMELLLKEAEWNIES